MATGAIGAKPNIFQRMSRFLREAWLELKKTSWPNADTLKKSTLLVLAAIAVVSIWIAGLDSLFGLVTKRWVGW